MGLSAFSDRHRMPSDADVRAALGRAYAPWARLLALLAERIHPISEVWGFTSATTGWGLRVRHHDRVILYMTPQSRQFLVSFALGEKAVEVARAARLSVNVLKAIDEAPRYAEGRGVRLAIRNSRELTSLARLAEIKQRS